MKLPSNPAPHPFDPEVFAKGERKAQELEWETRRVAKVAALQERNMKEARFGVFKRPECEEVLDAAFKLEDAGRLEEAQRLYQKVLAQEPEHHELRHYIDVLNARINVLALGQRQAARQQQLAVRLAGEAPAASLQLAGFSREPPERRGKASRGARVGLAPSEYAAQLAEQVREAEERRQAARRHEEELEKREVSAAQRQHARDKYAAHVGGGNDKLAFKYEVQEHMDAQRQERMRKWMLEQQHDPVHAPSGPLLGMGELDAARAAAQLRARNAEWHREQARISAAAQNPWSDPAHQQPQYSVLASPSGAQGSVRQQYSGSKYSPAVPQVRPGSATPQGGYYGGQQQYGQYEQYMQEEFGGQRGGGGHGATPSPGYGQGQGGGGGGGPRRAQSAGPGRPTKAAQAEAVRAARYPGVRPTGQAPARPWAPFARSDVDQPVQPVDPRAVRARQAAFYAKHAKPPTPERPGNRRVTPQGYQRPPDGAGIVADRLLVRG